MGSRHTTLLSRIIICLYNFKDFKKSSVANAVRCPLGLDFTGQDQGRLENKHQITRKFDICFAAWHVNVRHETPLRI